MPENEEQQLFADLQRKLNAAMADSANSKISVAKLREKLAALQREKESLDRVFSENNEQHLATRRRLMTDEQAANTAMEDAVKGNKDQSNLILERLRSFGSFADPRTHIKHLDDQYPILLLPVRLETRFKVLQNDRELQHELWIRIYPDECAVDTFEELLSETEVKNAVYYWQKIWEAGEDEDLEKGAWRTLVSSHGSGRSAYLINQFKPASFGERLKRNSKEEIILVILSAPPTAQNEKDELESYWTGLWKITGDAAKEKLLLDELINQLGAPAANALIEKYAPANMDASPAGGLTKTDSVVRLAYLPLPPTDTISTKLQSWSQRPLVHVLPDSFVVIGYKNEMQVFNEMTNIIPTPLAVGPDPSSKEGEAFKADANGDMIVEEEIKWMTDFNAAIAKGMGIKIRLTAEQAAAGFDSIITLGVKLSADKNKGQSLVEELIDHHRKGRKGFSILPQGTPTNNTENEASGYQQMEDADQSFANLKKQEQFTIDHDPLKKSDGQWLAEALGIKNQLVQKISNSGQTDQRESMSMNIALWPATFGYLMETMLEPAFSEQDVTFTRNFFNRYVTGRGRVPVVRVGKQPYGILPCTAFARTAWFRQPEQDIARLHAVHNQGNGYLAKLAEILKTIQDDWSGLKDKVSSVMKNSGDPHKDLAEALGLHASSLEFYQRTAESIEDLYNRHKFKAKGHLIVALANIYTTSGMNVLKKFGYTGAEVPNLFTKFFMRHENRLKGGAIDDVPLSEKDPIRKYTDEPGAQNYIEWLIEAAQSSHDVLRKQEGFTDDKIPTALLYLFLQHSLDLGYIEVSIKLFREAQLLSDAEAKLAKKESAFLHIKTNKQESESRWKYLYASEQKVTKDPTMYVGDFIPQILKTEVASAYLNEQIEALEELKLLSTAKLERLFAEHIDCCSHRLDAWKSGLLNYQLEQMRKTREHDNEQWGQGLYVGAYGYLENVKKIERKLEPAVTKDEELHDIFIKDQAVVPMKDSSNGGYILAPSLNQAVTASILRSAYQNNNNPETLRVNLSSERVRKALSIIEGIRAGQPLGAVLGYYLERGLHEGYPGLELDFFIYQLRKAFPLTTNKNTATTVKDEDAKEAEVIEARNVIDGLSLIEFIAANKVTSYPFGKSFLTKIDDPKQGEAIDKEVAKIIDLNDAIADLALAESVHQVVQGNYERGAATLDSFSKGNFPPIPDIIQTPRSGTNITHRVGLHFASGLDPSAGLTPRAKAEPGINLWLKDVLPSMDNIVCHVTYGTVIDEEVNMNQLQLEPIDLLYLLHTDNNPAMMLDDLVLKFVMDKGTLRPDQPVTIHYMNRTAGKFCLFEISALVRTLKSLLLKSRPLTATDVSLPNSKREGQVVQQFLDKNRVKLRYDELNTLWNGDLKNYKTAIDQLHEDVVANKVQLIMQAEKFTNDLLKMLYELSKSGIDQSAFGFIYDRKRTLFENVNKKVTELIERWNEKKLRFTGLMNDYNNLPLATADTERFELLEKARGEISTRVPTGLTTPAAYEQDVRLILEPLFTARLMKFQDIRDTSTVSLSTLAADARSISDIEEFDLVSFDIDGIEKDLLLWVEDLAKKAGNVYIDLEKRLLKTQALLTEAGNSTDTAKAVEKLMEAGKQIYHEDFRMVPEFSLPGTIGDEWTKSLNNSVQLLKFAKDNGTEYPMDNWLYGISRVREKMQYWEQLLLLSEAAGKTELTMDPVQLPHRNDDSWLALEVPPEYQGDSDKLLYTAHYAVPFDKTKRQCGLLLDDWTELIPAKKETTGIAFHYDRPSSEPAQVMLLALPASSTGAWKWDDLVDAVKDSVLSAKLRAIEPAMINETAYGRLLPALYSSSTALPITAGLNLSFNNSVHEKLNL